MYIGFSQTLFVFDRVSKNIQISNLLETRPTGAEFFNAVRHDRRDEANIRCSQFCESTKRGQFISIPLHLVRRLIMIGTLSQPPSPPPGHFQVFIVCTEILFIYIKECARLWTQVESVFLNIYRSGNIFFFPNVRHVDCLSLTYATSVVIS
jgi:hypothetical protein